MPRSASDSSSLLVMRGIVKRFPGVRGMVAFGFEAMNDLWFHDHTLGNAEQGFRRVRVTEPDHPSPSFEEGPRVQRVPAAVEQSAAEGSRFTTVEDS